MANNPHADGTAEDLIRAFVQIGCTEVHLKTLLEKATAQAEEGLIDVNDYTVLSKHTEKIEELTEEIAANASLRRRIMLRLFDMYQGDKDYWCVVKHLGIGAYTLFEAYQASDDDPVLMEMALTANKRFIKALSRFLGTEITDCAACFADILKAK